MRTPDSRKSGCPPVASLSELLELIALRTPHARSERQDPRHQRQERRLGDVRQALEQLEPVAVTRLRHGATLPRSLIKAGRCTACCSCPHAP